MKIPHCAAILTVSLWGTVSPSLLATTLVDDSFADNDRSTQNPPASIQFFATSSTVNLAVASNLMTLTTGSAGRGGVGFFAPQGSPVTLTDVGDALTFILDFAIDPFASPGTSTNTFRLGFLDSDGGTRMSADNTGNSFAGYAGMDGYAAAFSVNTNAVDSTPVGLFKKVTSAASGLGSFGSAPTILWESLAQGGPGAVENLAAATPYTATLMLQKTGDSELTLTGSITGGALSGFTFSTVDSTSPNFSFDGIAFQVGSNTYNTTAISRVQVEYAPIPEPAVSGLLAVFGVLSGFGLVRRFFN